jgi:hypothetical protein
LQAPDRSGDIPAGLGGALQTQNRVVDILAIILQKVAARLARNGGDHASAPSHKPPTHGKDLALLLMYTFVVYLQRGSSKFLLKRKEMNVTAVLSWLADVALPS